MAGRSSRRHWRRTAGARFLLSLLGVVLIIVSPIIGALPGPGFIIIFPIGLALVLQNSRWAKKRYVDFKRHYPRYGMFTDWVMRRRRHRELPPGFRLPLLGRIGGKGAAEPPPGEA